MTDWYDEVGAWIECCKSPEEIQRLLANWVETAAQNQKNTEFYRGLLVKCGEIIGERAYRRKDGTLNEDVLCLNIPEIIGEDYGK